MGYVADYLVAWLPAQFDVQGKHGSYMDCYKECGSGGTESSDYGRGGFILRYTNRYDDIYTVI